MPVSRKMPLVPCHVNTGHRLVGEISVKMHLRVRVKRTRWHLFGVLRDRGWQLWKSALSPLLPQSTAIGPACP